MKVHLQEDIQYLSNKDNHTFPHPGMSMDTWLKPRTKGINTNLESLKEVKFDNPMSQNRQNFIMSRLKRISTKENNYLMSKSSFWSSSSSSSSSSFSCSSYSSSESSEFKNKFLPSPVNLTQLRRKSKSFIFDFKEDKNFALVTKNRQNRLNFINKNHNHLIEKKEHQYNQNKSKSIHSKKNIYNKNDPEIYKSFIHQIKLFASKIPISDSKSKHNM